LLYIKIGREQSAVLLYYLTVCTQIYKKIAGTKDQSKIFVRDRAWSFSKSWFLHKDLSKKYITVLIPYLTITNKNIFNCKFLVIEPWFETRSAKPRQDPDPNSVISGYQTHV
jgi:hypothetical protein